MRYDMGWATHNEVHPPVVVSNHASQGEEVVEPVKPGPGSSYTLQPADQHDQT